MFSLLSRILVDSGEMNNYGIIALGLICEN